MYKNYEGYPDPTAGEAIAAVMREERKRRRREMKRAVDLLLKRHDVWQIASELGRSREYTVALLRDLLNILNNTPEVKNNGRH